MTRIHPAFPIRRDQWEPACNGGPNGKWKRQWFLFDREGETIEDRYLKSAETGHLRRFATASSARAAAAEINAGSRRSCHDPR